MMFPAEAKIENLRIENFRALQSLSIKGMSTVNLFVGKNNTGKTTVLEAIHLYYAEDSILRLGELLSSRDEYSFGRKRRLSATFDREPPLAFESLFYGRPDVDREPWFLIGTDDYNHQLRVSFTWVRRVADHAGTSIRYERGLFGDATTDPDVLPGFEVSDGNSSILFPADRLDRLSLRRRSARYTESSVAYLPSAGMTSDEIGRVWDAIALTSDESFAIEALRSIVPTLEKLVLVQSPQMRGERVLMAKLSEFDEPVPFKSLGEGAIHVLGIVLALIKARGGVLLADEIENGVHYSVQSQLWELIFRQAKAWNIQVFATTHSWDCVLGFEHAAEDHQQDAQLFRLEKYYDHVRAVSFTPKELAIAERESIEIR